MHLLDTIRRLYAHDLWAREQLLAHVEALTPEQFAQKHGALDSVRVRFTHIVDIDDLWIGRVFERRSPPELPSNERFDDPRAFVAHAREVAQRRDAKLATLNDADLATVVTFTNTFGVVFTETIGDMLLQVALHAAHHRGQVTLCLKALGLTVDDTDYYKFAAHTHASTP